MAAAQLLTEEWRWYPWGSLTPEEAAQAWNTIILNAYDDVSLESVPAPYWDTDDDVDDEEPESDPVWYGTVEDPDAPPEELTFVENAAIWAFTGFIAAATWEVGFAPAILFHTIAPRFVLAMKRGDAGEIIRILIDGEDAALVDTTDAAVGDIVKTTVMPDPAVTTGHDIMIIQVS